MPSRPPSPDVAWRRWRARPVPLLARRVMRWEYEEKRRYQVLDEETTRLVAERELRRGE